MVFRNCNENCKFLLKEKKGISSFNSIDVKNARHVTSGVLELVGLLLRGQDRCPLLVIIFKYINTLAHAYTL